MYGGGKIIKDVRKTIKFKKIKNGLFSFFGILQLPHTVNSNSEKLTHPTVQYTEYCILPSTWIPQKQLKHWSDFVKIYFTVVYSTVQYTVQHSVIYSAVQCMNTAETVETRV